MFLIRAAGRSAQEMYDALQARLAHDETTEHRTDELGELAVDAPDLPLRLEIDLPSGTTITPWITA